MSALHPVCSDSMDGDIHPAAAHHHTCAFHRTARRNHATNKSTAIAAGLPYPDYEPIPRTPAARFTNPAITVTPASTDSPGTGDIVIVIPRQALDDARAAMASEEAARDAWRRASPADRQRAGDRLAQAALTLNQATDPLF